MSCSQYLNLYPNTILIETGSGNGTGIKRALGAGFQEVHSIEIDPARYAVCLKKFVKNSKVHLYLGDSAVILPKILENIVEPCTILLDAHIMEMTEIHAEILCPVIQELKMVCDHGKLHNIKHKILIDDIGYFNGSFKSFGCINLNDLTSMATSYWYTIKNNRKFISCE